jgi:hypothetical protein
MKLLSTAALAALACTCITSFAAEVYGGAGTTGFELGVSSNVGDRWGARAEVNSLNITRRFTTSNIDYDARVKFSNAGVYVDWFVASSFRLTGGALIGSRKIHGAARSIGNTLQLNGVVYPVVAGDGLDFDAKFPNVTPYIGVGWGHNTDTPGLHVYGDAGVAVGRPEVTLTPTASLAARLNPGDLASEQSSAQNKANDLRNYPVFKFGLRYTY